jgi:tetratricopeptide (TPR) repeat protein
VTPRARVGLIVAALAAVAATLAVAVAATSGPDETTAAPSAAPKPRPGRPPLAFRFGVRDDAETRDLLRGAQLLQSGHVAEARALFGRYDSLEAKIGTAFASWPVGTVDRMIQLAGLYPRSALVQLHLGLALLWANDGAAADAWREAEDVEPDSPYAIVAADLLHPSFAPGIPLFVPSAPLPAAVVGKPAADQLRLLRDGASRGQAWRLYYGVALQRAGRRLSAQRAFDAAVRASPRSAEPLVAAAVSRFDKSDPAEAFSRLGPLTRRFPRSASVRFHLGLMLLWTGRLEEARRQLQLAQRAQPGSPLAREAERWLERLPRRG